MPKNQNLKSADDYTEEQIEWMREKLIYEGRGGCFGNANPISYWSAEEIVEAFQVELPQVKVPSW